MPIAKRYLVDSLYSNLEAITLENGKRGGDTEWNWLKKNKNL
jgi:hypothetical protein